MTVIKFLKLIFGFGPTHETVFRPDLTYPMKHCTRARCPKCDGKTFEIFYSGRRRFNYFCPLCHWASDLF